MSHLRDEASRIAIKVADLVRRVVVERAIFPLWEISGHAGETDDGLPVFQNIGFSSRPRDGAAGTPTGDSPEAVSLSVAGASGQPVIVCTRDELLRLVHTAVKEMAADEAAMYNSQARVHILADGTVMVDDGSGAVALAKADHAHLPGTFTAGATAVTGLSATSNSNTTVLMGK